MADEVFESAQSGAALTYPVRAGELKKGHHVVIKGHPCKVIELTTSKTGKHGHAKANITALDIFTGNKYMDISPTSHNMEAPFVTKVEYSILDIQEDDETADGTVVQLILADDATAEPREDLRLPLEEKDAKYGEIRAKFEDGEEVVVQVQKAMGIEMIMPEFRIAKN